MQTHKVNILILFAVIHDVTNHFSIVLKIQISTCYIIPCILLHLIFAIYKTNNVNVCDDKHRPEHVSLFDSKFHKQPIFKQTSIFMVRKSTMDM